MRLTLVISSLAAGGAERVITTMANHWVDMGHVVRLITTHDGGHPPHYPLDAAVDTISVDPRRGGLRRQVEIVRGLRREVRSGSPHVVISFLNYTNILTLTATWGLGTPTIISERLDPRVIGIGPVWSLARRLTYRRATYLVAQTPTAARLYEPLAPGRVLTIPNPVPPPVVGGATPDGYGDPDRPTILAVGRLQDQKGFDIAIRALTRLPDTFRNWRLVILGEGSQRAELERLRDDLGLAGRVEMPGRVASPWPWLERAQVFLMSSRTEGFPNALCEAMAAGLPVISTDCPSGPADIITDGDDGLLVPPEDPAAMADRLAELLGDPELRARLGRAAPAISARYSLAAVLRAWDDLVAAVAPDSGD